MPQNGKKIPKAPEQWLAVLIGRLLSSLGTEIMGGPAATGLLDDCSQLTFEDFSQDP